jgi:uncharacterized coiled-coil protein SlyX
MARESVDIAKLTEVSPTDLIEELSKENSELRLKITIMQKVINNLVTHIQDAEESDTESDED